MLFSIGSIYVVKTRDFDASDAIGRERIRASSVPVAMTTSSGHNGNLGLSSRSASPQIER